MKKKAHKDTKELLDNTQAAGVESSMLSTNWQGRITIVDAEKSFIAKKLGMTKNGEYAIKVR